MRVENLWVLQPLIDSTKATEKKELTSRNPKEDKPVDEPRSFWASPLGFSGTYSVSSLKAAVDYHAKFLTVAESNVAAAQHSPTIPQAILDRLSRQ